MGCKQDKVKTEECVIKQIETEFEYSDIEETDKYWKQVETISIKLEQMRQAIEDHKIIMEYISGVYKLEVSSLQDSIQIFLWSLSANNEGDISKINIKLDYNQFPFFYMNLQLKEILQQFYDSLFYYINGFKLGLKIIDEFEKTIIQLYNQSNQIINQTTAITQQQLANQVIDLKHSNLISVYQQNNLIKLQNNVLIVRDLRMIIKTNENQQQVEQIFYIIQDLLSNTDNFGKQAIEKSVFLMIDIFDKFYQGKRKSDDQIQKDKKIRKQKIKIINKMKNKVCREYFEEINKHLIQQQIEEEKEIELKKNYQIMKQQKKQEQDLKLEENIFLEAQEEQELQQNKKKEDQIEGKQQ